MKITGTRKVTPAQVCSDCGHEQGTKQPTGATWQMGTCGVCREFTNVTAAGEFGRTEYDAPLQVRRQNLECE